MVWAQTDQLELTLSCSPGKAGFTFLEGMLKMLLTFGPEDLLQKINPPEILHQHTVGIYKDAHCSGLK